MDYQKHIGRAGSDLGEQLYGLAQKSISLYMDHEPLIKLMKDRVRSEFEATIINCVTIEFITRGKIKNDTKVSGILNSMYECLMNDYADQGYLKTDFMSGNPRLLPDRLVMHRRELSKLLQNDDYLAPQTAYHFFLAPLEAGESIDNFLSQSSNEAVRMCILFKAAYTSSFPGIAETAEAIISSQVSPDFSDRIYRR